MNEYRITGLELNGVGVFDKLKLSFPEKKLKDKAEIHIFTGVNGTGKTTLLQALTYFDIKYNRDYYNEQYKKSPFDFDTLEPKWKRESENFDEDRHFDKRRHKHDFEREREREDVSVKLDFNKKSEWGASQYKSDTHYIKLQDLYKYHIVGKKSSTWPDYSFFLYTGQRQIVNSNIEVFKEVEFNALVDALDFNRTGLNSNLFQWIANIKTKAALAFQKGDKKRSDSYLKNISAVEQALSEIIGRKIEFIVDENALQVRVNLNEMPIQFNDLAEGYKSIISWLVDLFFRLDAVHFDNTRTFTLFLDEIDVHLHPAAQRKILPVIQKLFPNAQIFLTTHSPFVIGSVDGAWIYKFKFDEKGNSVLDGEPVLSEDGLSYNYIVKEILGVEENFGVEVEEKLKDFYIERDKIMAQPDSSADNFLKLSKELAVQSMQLQSIIGSELRQLSRITKKEFSI